MGSADNPGSPRVMHAGVSPEEWHVRCDLAACYQLADLYGMSGTIGTHISARVPGPDDHFLLNPLGTFFDEITASSLIKVDVDGNMVSGSREQMNPAGFVIHSAIHMARPDLICVMHTHTTANNGVAMLKDGLLPLTQNALMLRDFLAYHDYEGAALFLDERERIVQDLGPDGRCMILRNHGALTVGRSVGEAFSWMYMLETACRQQVAGLAGNRELCWLSLETVDLVAAQGRATLGSGGWAECGKQDWPGLVRKLERDRGPSYRS